MRALHIILGLAVVAVPVVALAVVRHQQVRGDSAEAPPPPATGGVALGGDTDTPASAGTVVVEQPQPSAGIGKLLQTAGSILGGSTVGATIGAGLTVANLQGLGVALAGGNEAQVNAARVFGPTATASALAQLGTMALGDALGVSQGVTRTAGQAAAAATAAGLVLGAPAAVGVAISKGVGEAASAALGLVLGEGAERAVRGTLSEFDPFKSGSVASTVVGGVANLVFGGWGGGDVIIKGGMSPLNRERAAAGAVAFAATNDRKTRGGAREEV